MDLDGAARTDGAILGSNARTESAVGPSIILLFMLVAVFAMAALLHLLVWMRTTAARARLWFGLGSLAAAGAIAAYCVVPSPDDSAVAVSQRISIFFCMAWLVAMTWFTVEYAAGDGWRRRLAVLLTLMFAAIFIGHLMFPATPDPAASADAWRPLGVLGDVALLALLGLVADGTVRLWRAGQRFHALTLGAGMGVALVAIGLHGTLLDMGLVGLRTPVPYAFLVIVLLMTYQLADTVAATQSLSERQRQGLVHTSRLAIVGQLTATIAHEINQPLGAILSNSDAGEILLERADPPLDEIRQILADIRRDGLRASGVIHHVRTLVRNPQFTLEKLDANAVAKDVISLVAPEARRRRITLEEALTALPAYIRGDRARLEQVLLNLMLNAMDAMDAIGAPDGVESALENRPPITLGVSGTAYGEIEFRIVDAGAGIPAERLDQLFDSFHTSKAHGIGLGLSIARSIVEAHGGRIRAENNSDAGATFRVTLSPFDETVSRPT